MATGKMNRTGTRRRRPHKASRTYTPPRPHAAPAVVQPANARLETLAVYRPTSLFLILLIATVVPRGTFSLRLLAPGGDEAAGLASLLSLSWLGNDRADGGGCCPAARPPRRGGRDAPSWRAEGTGAGTRAPPCDADGGALSELWEDVSSALCRSAGDARPSGGPPAAEDDGEGDWLADAQSTILGVPRGGGSPDFESDDGESYSGLVNLGNTCYLNSQLQCAYHVPYLRKLILEAEDEVVEVEVEVEEEVDEEEERRDDDEGGECGSGDASAIGENCAAERPASCDEEQPDATDAPRKRTRIRKETRRETVPISQALRALQQSFGSLSRSTAGTTAVLCRALGINPYLQQDGQEFWKLFIPELDFPKMAELYSGHFVDYLREVVDDDEDCAGEEKKSDEDATAPRERIKNEPFLDLSIPVAEGGGSVESTLAEMFTQPELLRVSEGNGWRPSKGSPKVDAHKGSSLQLAGLPSLLQLHLKRFKYDWDSGETSKINDCCSFPRELDLSDIVEDASSGAEDDTIYDLQSIVIHKGEYGSGHYYSYVRPDVNNDRWYRFDDELVVEVAYEDVVADAFGGARRKRNRSRGNSSADGSGRSGVVRRRGLFRLIRSLFGFLRPVRIGGCNYGYGGRSSSAYQLQYTKRSDASKLMY